MNETLIIMLPQLTTLVFVFAMGACIGSLVNVLVYRLPRGMDVVRPTSRCPKCQTKLTFRENVPIIGWLMLRGKCRFCKESISPEYPIVETIVAVMFAGLFVLWYMVPGNGHLLGIPFGSVSPEWADNPSIQTWPAFVVLLCLVGSLVAMTIVDAKTFTIPLVLTWVPAGTALLLHVGHAVWFTIAHGQIDYLLPGLGWRATDGFRWVAADGWHWTLATPGPGGWRWIGIALGGIAGLGLSLVLMRLGLIRRSFADYEQWEQAELAKVQAEQDASGTSASDGTDNPTNMWIQYPHARREMVKEAAFLAPPVALALGGGWLASRLAGPWTWEQDLGRLVPAVEAPLWLMVLAGVLLGYLIGGGVVWAVRLFGSLAFGKEAMGLGDVHMMAAVGACLGWIDPSIAFFTAAFVGVGWWLLALVASGKLNRAMPYGPFLAFSTLLVILFKPGVEAFLSRLLGQAVDIP